MLQEKAEKATRCLLFVIAYFVIFVPTLSSGSGFFFFSRSQVEFAHGRKLTDNKLSVLCHCCRFLVVVVGRIDDYTDNDDDDEVGKSVGVFLCVCVCVCARDDDGASSFAQHVFPSFFFFLFHCTLCVLCCSWCWTSSSSFGRRRRAPVDSCRRTCCALMNETWTSFIKRSIAFLPAGRVDRVRRSKWCAWCSRENARGSGCPPVDSWRTLPVKKNNKCFWTSSAFSWLGTWEQLPKGLTPFISKTSAKKLSYKTSAWTRLNSPVSSPQSNSRDWFGPSPRRTRTHCSFILARAGWKHPHTGVVTLSAKSWSSSWKRVVCTRLKIQELLECWHN